MSGRLLIWGAGGHGQVVADVAEACGWTVVAFAARDAGPSTAWRSGSLPVIEDRELRDALAGGAPLPYSATGVALGIGDNTARLAISELFSDPLLPVLIHPSAVVSPTARLSAGTVAMPQVVVNARAMVGRAVILNTGAVVEHDCRVGDGVHLSPGAMLGGEVNVGRLAWIGIGGVVIPRRTIGAGAMLGAGSTAHKDVPPGTTYVGNPARAVPGRSGP